MDDYTRRAAVLTAFAESDFRSDAVQRDPVTGEAKTFGVFQQMPKYWPSAMGSTAEQCRAFLAAFRDVTGDPVRDCWRVQRWLAPDPAVDLPGFLAADETKNYVRRLPLVAAIIQTGRLP